MNDLSSILVFQSVPMWRLTERMVRSTLVTACRLATSPTSTSPFLAKATTDGVVRAPSAFAMTVGSPPSRTATTEFVVPRSIPTARAMVCTSSCVPATRPEGARVCAVVCWVRTRLSRCCKSVKQPESDQLNSCHRAQRRRRDRCSRGEEILRARGPVRPVSRRVTRTGLEALSASLSITRKRFGAGAAGVDVRREGAAADRGADREVDPAALEALDLQPGALAALVDAGQVDPLVGRDLLRERLQADRLGLLRRLRAAATRVLGGGDGSSDPFGSG